MGHPHPWVPPPELFSSPLPLLLPPPLSTSQHRHPSCSTGASYLPSSPQVMPKREEQLTRAMVGRLAIQKRLTDEEIIDLERKERQHRILRKKFAEGTGEVVKERYTSKAQQKKERIAAREAELKEIYEAEKETPKESGAAVVES